MHNFRGGVGAESLLERMQRLTGRFSLVSDLDGLVAGLGRVGEILAAALPASAENPQELDDAPRLYT